jgi:hypothetical protein
MKSGVEEWSLLGCCTLLTAKYCQTYCILNSSTFLYLVPDHLSFPVNFLACTSCGSTHSMTSVSLLSQLFLTYSIPIFSGKASHSLTALSRSWNRMPPAMPVTVTSWHSVLLIYLFTYWLTYPMEQNLKKVTGSQIIKKLPALYETWRFITTFSSAYYLSLSLAISIHPVNTV